MVHVLLKSGERSVMKKILLVDDVAFTLQMEREVFDQIRQEEGVVLEIDTASTVSEATGKLAHRIYDMVITDMNLTDGSGTEVAKTAAKMSLGYSKIVALTILPHVYEKERPYFDDFLIKPLLPTILKEDFLILLNHLYE